VRDRFGPPEIVRVDDVAAPVIGPGEVLVRVRAAALNPYDWHLLRGDPWLARLVVREVGVTRPRSRLVGLDMAGVVEAVGAGVRQPGVGDEVFGFALAGACAEYARAAADQVVAKPAGVTFEQAAAVPLAATTALRAVQAAALAPGHRLLVNGAAGGVGTFAVQLAAALGAEVTGVCGPGSADLLRGLGATATIDPTAEDFTARRGYDAVLDNVGSRRLRDLLRVLRPTGTLVLNGGGAPGQVIGAMGLMAHGAAAGLVGRRSVRPLVIHDRHAQLADLAGLLADGRLVSVIDSAHPLDGVVGALRHLEGGHTHGKIVIAVA
jgi:NADPH:quinone reductase-like Zn-dependent oxidoreductase